MASVSKRPRTRADGSNGDKWIVRYIDGGGAHRQKTFDRKKEAEQYRTKVAVEIAQGTHIAASAVLTVAEVADEFLKIQGDRVRDGRIGRQAAAQYVNAIERHVVPRMGGRPIVDVKPGEVIEFYRHMVRVGKLAPKTAKTRVAFLSQMFAFAEKRRLVHGNPAREALIELRGIVAAPVRTFTLDELRGLLTALHTKKHKGHDRSHHFLQCAVNLAACCGLRYGEILGLTIGAVDVDRGTIRIKHSLTRHDELKGPKTRAGLRDVPLPRHVAELIASYVDRHYLANPRELIFRTRTGGIIGTNSFHYAYWGPLLTAAGLGGGKRLHFHALRHFAASWMIENGWSLPDVAGILGHSKFDTTLQVYAHPIVGGSRKLEAMQNMADRLVEAAPTAALPAPEYLNRKRFVAHGLRTAA